MGDKYYDQADLFFYNDEIEKAIPLFVEAINHGNYDSAYRLGTIYLDCYEDLGFDEPNYLEAIKYFQIGASHEHKPCQKELGLLFATGDKRYRDYFKAFKLILQSGNYRKFDDIKLLKELLEYIRDIGDKQETDNLEKNIDFYNECAGLTRFNTLLDKIYSDRNHFIRKYALYVILKAKRRKQLENEFHYFNKYMDEDFMVDIKVKYIEKKIKLFCKECVDVNEAIEFYDNLCCDSFFKNRAKILDGLLLWIAQSFRYGTNGVIPDKDKAIDYYDKIENSLAKKEREQFVYEICKKSLNEQDLVTARKYVYEIRSASLMREEIINAINEIKEKNHFITIERRASLGDYYASLELANLYKKGKGTNKNVNKAYQIYLKLFNLYHGQEEFDCLFKWLEESDSQLELLNLIKQSYQYSLKLSAAQLTTRKKTVIKHCERYARIRASDLTSINIQDNIIYYLFDYYKKWWIENYPNNSLYKKNYFTFISIKEKKCRQDELVEFFVCINKFLKLLSGDWIICTAPGHEKTENISNGVSKVIQMCQLKSNFYLRNTLIQRTKTIEKKATSSTNRLCDFIEELQSLKVEQKFDVTDKNIIVIDDITTTGCTLIACKNLLKDYGAKHVVLLALGKTKEY